jgi:hypothetical protein
MSPHQTACPRCALPLQSNKPFATGQQLRCPRCTLAFLAPGPQAAPEPPGLSWLPAPAPAADAFDLPLDLPAAPEPAAPPRRRGTGWVGILLGLLLLAGALAVGMLMHSGGTSLPAPELAAAAPSPEPSPTPASAPAGPTSPKPPQAKAPASPPPLPDRQSPAPSPPKKSKPPQAKPKPPAPAEPEPLPAPKAKDSPVKGWLPDPEQRRVDEAMIRAIEYLKRRQLDTGSWHDTFYTTGHAALPALALLECGVPADDPVVQKAVQYVRDQVPTVDHTYEIALALLLLDRLGAKDDEGRIRSLALRLLAGQEARGGWTYTCPLLSPEEEDSLMVALQKTRPRSPLDLFVQVTEDKPAPRGPKPPLDTDVSRPGGEPLEDGVRRPREPAGEPEGSVEVLPPPAAARPGTTLPLAREAARTTPRKPARPLRRPEGRAPAEALPPPQPEVDNLPPQLRNLPAVQPAQRYQRPSAADRADSPSRSYNSNTQFAVLGLWAARRHGVPMDRALALVTWRFRTSQNADGGWDYKYAAGGRNGRASMTGSALLGLAVGQGLTYDYRRHEQDRVPADPRIHHGLAYLAETIDPTPMDRFFARGPDTVPPDFDSYLLWTVERVGVLYNLRQIEGRDWYRWGASQLLAVQQRNGSWPYGRGQERPVVGTSFGLLFLKGSNLVPDLTRKLEAARDEKKLNHE